MTLRKYIKTQRLLLGYTQQRLATIIGVNVSSVVKWEMGIQRPGRNLVKTMDALRLNDTERLFFLQLVQIDL